MLDHTWEPPNSKVLGPSISRNLNFLWSGDEACRSQKITGNGEIRRLPDLVEAARPKSQRERDPMLYGLYQSTLRPRVIYHEITSIAKMQRNQGLEPEYLPECSIFPTKPVRNLQYSHPILHHHLGGRNGIWYVFF